MTLQFPTPAKDLTGSDVYITAGWGDNRGHKGCDVGSGDGMDVGTHCFTPSLSDGAVVAVKDDGPFRPPNGHTAGINVHVLCDDGTRWKFFHLNRALVEVGQRVTPSTPIGEIGHTGTGATHLHIEEHAYSFSNPVNCEPALREALAAGRFPGSTPAPTTVEDDMPPYSEWSQEDRDALATDVWAAVSGEKRAQAQDGSPFKVPGRLALDDLPSDLEALKLAVNTVQKILEGKG